MPRHDSFRDRNPRSALLLETLANGLPDALDFGSGSGNRNQRTERVPPVDAATQPTQPPRRQLLGSSNLVLLGVIGLVIAVVAIRR